MTTLLQLSVYRKEKKMSKGNFAKFICIQINVQSIVGIGMSNIAICKIQMPERLCNSRSTFVVWP